MCYTTLMNNICEHPNCNNRTKTKQARFCSLSCANSANKSKKGRNPPKRVCALEDCEIIFASYSRTRKFCSHSCAAKFINASRKNKEQYCTGCAKPTSRRAKYCSVSCRQDHEVVLWLAGELDGNTTYSYAAYVRRYLEDRSRGVCEMSDCNENRTHTDGSSILQVDHIDGNWRNTTVLNIRLICPTCHVLTDNWGAKNKGNGRTWKKDYNQFLAK